MWKVVLATGCKQGVNPENRKKKEKGKRKQ